MNANPSTTETSRSAERTPIEIAARLTWKDKRGMTRFASVIARNVSESGIYVECPSEIAIQPYRLVQFQAERVTGENPLPASLRQGARVLSAVYRITPPTKAGRHQGIGLRILTEPKRATSFASSRSAEQTRATA